MRLASYLYPSTRTTFRMLQSAMRGHNFHVNEVDICRVSLREAPRRASSPFRLRANHLLMIIKLLQSSKPKGCVRIYQSGSSPMRRFESWNRVVEVVDPLEDPTTSPCCQVHPSTISNHPDWYRCTMHRLCVPGTVSPACCYSDPTLRCCRRYNTRNKLWSRVRWLRRNKLVRLMLIRLWFEVSDSQDPK